MEPEKKRHPSEDKPWLFKPGVSGNPKGRPPGKTLKEYSRDYLSKMTDEERLEFLRGLPKEVIWKMAEGNPKQDTEANVKLEMPIPILNVQTNDSDKEGIEPKKED